MLEILTSLPLLVSWYGPWTTIQTALQCVTPLIKEPLLYSRFELTRTTVTKAEYCDNRLLMAQYSKKWLINSKIRVSMFLAMKTNVLQTAGMAKSKYSMVSILQQAFPAPLEHLIKFQTFSGWTHRSSYFLCFLMWSCLSTTLEPSNGRPNSLFPWLTASESAFGTIKEFISLFNKKKQFWVFLALLTATISIEFSWLLRHNFLPYQIALPRRLLTWSCLVILKFYMVFMEGLKVKQAWF